MNGGKHGAPASLGYTIVEVLIFLAISGFMFVVAAVLVSGKQANAEFRQGINDINTQIRGIVNDVASGVYPALPDGYRCANVGGVVAIQAIGAGGTVEQGANNSCVDMGKVVQFMANGDGLSYYVYTVAGLRQNTDGSTVTSFADAKPIALDGAAVNLTDKQQVQNGTKLTSALLCITGGCTSAGTGTPISAVGFFGSFGATNSAAPGDLASGAQTVTTVTFGSNTPNNEGNMVANINTHLQQVPSPISTARLLASNAYVLLCFDGGKDHKGSVTIGGQNGQQLTTSISYGWEVTPACGTP